MSEPNFYKMTDLEMLEYCGDNAARWAEAFCRIKEKQGWGAMDIDESLMIGWFANAIEHSTEVRSRPQTKAHEMDDHPKILTEEYARQIVRTIREHEGPDADYMATELLREFAAKVWKNARNVMAHEISKMA
jgi:hypothetical protein